MKRGVPSSSSSSSDDDDRERTAAFRSVAVDSSAILESAAPAAAPASRKSRANKRAAAGRGGEDDEDDGDGFAGLKLHQTRLQDLLHRHLDHVLEEFSERTASADDGEGSVANDSVAEDGAFDKEVRLFSDGPLGVALTRSSTGPKGRRLPPRYDSSDEDTSERDARFRAVAVEGLNVRIQAESAQAKAQARFLAAEDAAHRAEKAEKDRVQRLREERGEEWLPAVAKDMMKDIGLDTQRRKTMSSEGKTGVVVAYRLS